MSAFGTDLMFGSASRSMERRRTLAKRCKSSCLEESEGEDPTAGEAPAHEDAPTAAGDVADQVSLKHNIR